MRIGFAVWDVQTIAICTRPSRWDCVLEVRWTAVYNMYSSVLLRLCFVGAMDCRLQYVLVRPVEIEYCRCDGLPFTICISTSRLHFVSVEI